MRFEKISCGKKSKLWCKKSKKKAKKNLNYEVKMNKYNINAEIMIER